MSLHEEGADEARQDTPNHAGWATFEARVRGRRFARCIDRAAASIEQGDLEDARGAVEEARTLSPGAPEIDELEQRMAAQPKPGAIFLAADLQESESDPGWPRVIAGIAAVVVLFLLLGAGLLQLSRAEPARLLFSMGDRDNAPAEVGTNGRTESEQEVTSSGRRGDTAAVRPAQPTAQAPTIPPNAENRTARETASAASAPVQGAGRTARPRVTPSPIDTPPPQESTLGLQSRMRSAPTTGTPTPNPPARGATAPAPPRVEPRQQFDERASASALASPSPAPSPAVAALVDRTPASASLDVPVPAVHMTADSEPRPDESERIRSVLLRYENAYNRLDAKEASSVWPRVNQTALDRAFSGLLSQRVSLGLCDITVIGDVGGASCAGKARWEPKVGGGLQTADRHWNFNLRKTGDGWRIEEIHVR